MKKSKKVLLITFIVVLFLLLTVAPDTASISNDCSCTTSLTILSAVLPSPLSCCKIVILVKYQEELKYLFEVYTDKEIETLFTLLSRLYAGIENLEKSN